MDFNDQHREMQPEKRSTFLTVLCILTFVGSSWLIITNVWSYSTASKSAKMFSEVMRREGASTRQSDTVIQKKKKDNHSMFGEKMMVSVSKIMTEQNIRKNAIGAIISGLFTLVGAI